MPNQEIALPQKNSGKDGHKTPCEISESFFISNYIGYIVKVYSIFCISFLFYIFKKKITNIQLASYIDTISNDHHV